MYRVSSPRAKAVACGTIFAQPEGDTMRVAIPTFGADISPRFCFAREMIVIELAARAEVERISVQLGDTSWPERLAILTAQQVDVLLCGGFPRRYLPVAEASGIQVVVGLVGTVEEVLSAFRNGTVNELIVFPRQGAGRGRGSSRGAGPRRAPVDDTKGKHQ